MRSADVLGGRRPNVVVEHKIRRDTRRVVTLLVEAGFDERFWRMYAAPDCRVVQQGQGGREAALKALDAARKHPEARMIAVLDADLDRVEGRLQLRDDLIWTDAHDLETTLASLPGLDKLFRYAIAPTALAESEERWGTSHRERLFEHALNVGRLRWLKVRCELDSLLFKKQGKGSQRGEVLLFDKYKDCVGDDWSPNLERTLHALLNYSQAHHLSISGLIAQLAELPEAAPSQVINGHDLLGFLWALFDDRKVGVEELAERLALATEREHIETTEMWHSLLAWEEAHPGFQVLKDLGTP